MANKNNSFTSTRNGASQIGRYNELLDASKVRIDNRSLADHIAFTHKLAEKVNFYGLDNKIDGNWQQFFGADEAILLARISILDTWKIDSKFQTALETFASEFDIDKKAELFVGLLNQTIDLVTTLDGWYRVSLSYNLTGQDTGLGIKVKNAIGYRLRDAFNELMMMIRVFDKKEYEWKVNLNLNKFDKIWKEEEPKESKTADQESNPDDEENGEGLFKDKEGEYQIVLAAKHLSLIFKSFLRTVTYIVNLAPALLEESVFTDKKHSPQNALYLAFLKLYEHVSQDLNDITIKHLDYYYFNKLEQQLRSPRPDMVFLNFTLADNTESYVLQANTLLEAGIDEEGLSYLYSTNEDVEITKALLGDVRVLYVAKDDQHEVSDEERNGSITSEEIKNLKADKKFRTIANIYQSEIATNPAGAIDFDTWNFPFSTFGTSDIDNEEVDYTVRPAQIGFAVSSSVLILKEGIRTIDIQLKFELKSMSSLVSVLENYALTNGMSAEGAFHKIFSSSFNISMSTIDGWYDIESYIVSPPVDWSEGVMNISFTLKQSAPAIAPLPTDLEEFQSYESVWPIIRFLLNAEESMYTYSFLSELRLESVEISVDVQKIKNLKLFNNLGKLDTGNPFFPFGSVPGVGSYLLIGYDELYNKNVEDISLNMLWHNQPRLDGGFDAYYQHYNEEITNDSFKFSLKALSGYEFLPTDDSLTQIFGLFETEETKRGETPHKRISSATDINDIDTEKLLIQPHYSEEELTDYDNTVKSGYLKLELTDPPIGFGHEVYPNLFASEVVEHAASSSKKSLSLPSVPYIPQLRSLEMNYKAKTKITMSRTMGSGARIEAKEKIYHIQPFGVRTIFKEAFPKENRLLPYYDADGYMILGFHGLKGGQTLTLYFSLEQNIGDNYAADLPIISWQYLSDDSWHPIPDKDIIYDGTNGFTVSGIIKLNIPKTISIHNRILPEGKSWLSAKVIGDPNLLSKTRGIYCHAVAASWVPHKENAEWSKPIPAHTIQRLAVSKSEVAAINQPDSSFFGLPKETSYKFYLRISERLRHKNRAITAWDYEHIVLEKFPYITQVKCLRSKDHQDISSGSVRLVVLPEIERIANFYGPKLDYGKLGEIQHYLHSLSSTFSKVEVINPVYEKLKIKASILFKDNSMKGELILKLNEDLRKFICPWFYNENVEMIFGSSIRKDDVLTFIQEREYVQFVTKMSLVIIHHEKYTYSLSDSAIEESNMPELSGSTPWSVLVPVSQHEINVIEEQFHETPERTAIEKMRLGEDFILADESTETVSNDDFPKYEDTDDNYFVINFDLEE